MYRRLLLAIVPLIAVCPPSASAQDVEMLGRRYGTRPPDAYFQEMARNPEAFRFARGRSARLREIRAFRSLGPGGAGAGGPALALGPRDQPVTGNQFVPVLLGLFNDSPGSPPVLQADVQSGYFGPQAGTVADLYAEMSNDSITLIGDVQDWVRSSLDSTDVAQGISGLGCCGIGDYITTLIDSLEAAGFDWSAYDNDGPDGVPNSPDDDGYVDALAVIHPKAGAECSGSQPNRIWSHKWTLGAASSAGSYETVTPSNSGMVPFIRVDDYFVQGVLTCSGGGLNEIGVLAHELGHAFGLPDLYDTRPSGSHEGAGSWDLMAAGTYGCSGSPASLPCHMGAWSKAVLGWVTVDTLPPDTDLGTLALPPVETSGLVYRVDAGDGSDEYFLLENRQRNVATFDQALWSEGLLIWQIDEGVVDARWPLNTVNSDDHMGVWLRQADGFDDLGTPGGGRGDSGDAFPGASGNTEFHAATNPAARSFQGTATGLSILNIEALSDDMTFDLSTRFGTISDVVVNLVATVPPNVQLMMHTPTPPVSWTIVGGSPPGGIVLQADGRVSGAALDLGAFPLVVEATDALGLTATAAVTLDVGAPSIPIARLGSDFLLGGQPLDSIQAVFLDRQGNRNGAYDLGDFRAWVLANPSLPLSAEIAPAEEPRVVIVPVLLGQPEETR